MFFKKNEKGQVLVEAAIVMPLMIFFTLGIMQMTMIQQAKIMVDYSAYAAARSGVVNNANPDSMAAAANIAVLPAYARTNNIQTLAKAYLMYTIGSFIQDQMEDLFGGGGGGGLMDVVTSYVYSEIAGYLESLGLPAGTFGFATVVVTSPLFSDFIDMSGMSGSGNPRTDKVIAGDDFDNLNESIAMQTTSRGVTNRDKNILTVAVSFNYELRIPFANWVIFEIWSASQVGVRLTGAIWRANAKLGGAGGWVTGGGNATGGGNSTDRATSRGILEGKMHGGGEKLRVFQKIRTPLGLLWKLNDKSIYIMPLYGTYSMRMHSNVYKSNLSEEVETLLTN